MNPVPFSPMLFNYFLYSTVFLTIGVIGIAACWIWLDLRDTGKKD